MVGLQIAHGVHIRRRDVFELSDSKQSTWLRRCVLNYIHLYSANAVSGKEIKKTTKLNKRLDFTQDVSHKTFYTTTAAS